MKRLALIGLLLCPLGTSPVVAQRVRPAVGVAVAGYASGREDGVGYGARIVAEYRQRPLGIRIDLALLRLGVLNQKCTLSIREDCFPATPPRWLQEVAVGLEVRRGRLLVAAGPAAVHRAYSGRASANFAANGFAGVELGRGRHSILEARFTRLIGSGSGNCGTLGLTVGL